MTKKTLWYVCLGLLCCLALVFVVQAAGVAPKPKFVKKAPAMVTTGAKVSLDSQVPAGRALSGSPVVHSASSQAIDATPSDASKRALLQQVTSAVEVPITAEYKAQMNAYYALRPENQPSPNPLDEGNEACPGLVIASIPYTDSGNTSDNVNDYTASCGASAATDVIYEYTPTETAAVTVSLCGSSYDTVIEVKHDGACPGTTLDACNDDYCGLQSQVTVNMVAGTTYYILVDGFSTGSGAYVINVTGPCSVTNPGCPLEGEPLCADEYVDTFNGGCNSIPPVYSTIACGGCVFGQSGNFLYGGSQYRDTDWYALTVPGDQAYTVNWTVTAEFALQSLIITPAPDCSNYTYVLATGGDCIPLTLSTVVAAGSTVWLWVGPSVFSGVPCGAEYIGSVTCDPAGDIRLCPDMTPADAVLDPVPTTPWGANVSGDAGNFGKWVGEFTGVAGQQYHFDLCPDAPGAGTASYDIDIKICDAAGNILQWQDGSCAAIAWHPNDFQWNCSVNGTYYVVLAPYYAGGHTCNGTVNDTHYMEYYSSEAPPAPANDACVNATVVPSFPYTDSSTNEGATPDAPCLGWPAEVWYTFTIAEPTDIYISLCGTTPSFATAGVAVEVGCPCTSYLLASTYSFSCADGNIEMWFYCLPAGTYYYALYTDVGSMGPYTINFDGTPCVPCDVVSTGTPEGEVCPNFPDNYNGGCNSSPFIFQTIQCNDNIAGTSDCDAVNYRDTDWFEVTTLVPNDFTMTVTAEFFVQIIILTPNPDCSNYTYILATGLPCDVVTLNTGPVPAGTYWFWVGQSNFSLLPCSEYDMVVTSAAPCDCQPTTDLTVYRGLGLADNVNLRWTGEAQGYYRVFGSTAKNNDGDPDNGADPQWTNLADLPGTAGAMTYTHGPLAPYMNYVVVHDCAPRGRCCYGDPNDPSCAANVTEETCATLYQGFWTEGDLSCPCPPIPAGENCANPIPLTVPGQATGNTCTYAQDLDAVCPYGGSTAPDVVYSYTSPVDQGVTFSTCATPDPGGFDVDSKLYVFQGTCTGTPIACSDDWCNYRSQVDCVPLLAGETYYIVVDGYGAWCGDYVLDATVCTPPPPVECPPGAVLEGEVDCYAEYVDATNGGCNSTPNVFGAINCGETMCGTTGTYLVAGGDNRDTDWIAVTPANSGTLDWTVNSTTALMVAIITPAPDCSNFTYVYTLGAAPGPTTITGTVVGGTPVWLFVAPTVFAGVPCGSDWVGTVTCP